MLCVILDFWFTLITSEFGNWSIPVISMGFGVNFLIFKMFCSKLFVSLWLNIIGFSHMLTCPLCETFLQMPQHLCLWHFSFPMSSISHNVDGFKFLSICRRSPLPVLYVLNHQIHFVNGFLFRWKICLLFLEVFPIPAIWT